VRPRADESQVDGLQDAQPHAAHDEHGGDDRQAPPPQPGRGGSRVEGFDEDDGDERAADGVQGDRIDGEPGADAEPGDLSPVGEVRQPEVPGVEDHLVDEPLLDERVRDGEEPHDRPRRASPSPHLADEQGAAAVERCEQQQGRKRCQRLVAQDELPGERRQEEQRQRTQTSAVRHGA
jgi:hypothetical protein